MRDVIEIVNVDGNRIRVRRFCGKIVAVTESERHRNEKYTERQKVRCDPKKEGDEKTPACLAAECERAPKTMRDDIHRPYYTPTQKIFAATTRLLHLLPCSVTWEQMLERYTNWSVSVVSCQRIYFRKDELRARSKTLQRNASKLSFHNRLLH